MDCIIELNTDSIAIITAVAAFITGIVGIGSLVLAYKIQRDNQRARIVLNVLQIGSDIYVDIRNIGKLTAFDLNIESSFSKFKDISFLHIAHPQDCYRFLFLNSSSLKNLEINEISFEISYKDSYNNKKGYKECASFVLSDVVQYRIEKDRDYDCYKINHL